MSSQMKENISPINNITKSIKESFLLQSKALYSVYKNLSELEYQKALDIIINCEGHVIISGIGKSGIVGKKIAATFSSLGTPSFFVHSAEAFHGDLGMITKKDIVILISNSGETDEVLRLLYTIKKHALPVISITGREESNLAKNSNAFLKIIMDRESCPFNLAPTTSTTITSAIGDALASALVNLKGFKREDFYKNHPCGSLGKILSNKHCLAL